MIVLRNLNVFAGLYLKWVEVIEREGGLFGPIQKVWRS